MKGTASATNATPSAFALEATRELQKTAQSLAKQLNEPDPFLTTIASLLSDVEVGIKELSESGCLRGSEAEKRVLKLLAVLETLVRASYAPPGNSTGLCLTHVSHSGPLLSNWLRIARSIVAVTPNSTVSSAVPSKTRKETLIGSQRANTHVHQQSEQSSRHHLEGLQTNRSAPVARHSQTLSYSTLSRPRMTTILTASGCYTQHSAVVHYMRTVVAATSGLTWH